MYADALVPPFRVGFSLKPITHLLRRKLLRKSLPLNQHARLISEIAPAEATVDRPAFHLPGQLERVRRLSEFGISMDEERSKLKGGTQRNHGATRALLLKNVVLLDGVLYKDNSFERLHSPAGRLPRFEIKSEIDHAALYCTPQGNKYFGNWLMDDCAAYRLAPTYGAPVTTAHPVSQHLMPYERALGMNPTRVESAFFKELVVFDDVGQNKSKHERFTALGNELRQNKPADSHPGVFILRGKSGQRRVLKNELELAEMLREKRGFRVLDATANSVQQIIDACAGARAVVGVEGSQLIHGLLMLPRGGSLLTLQPPDRYCTVYKDLTDRDEQHFGIVVGLPDGDDFTIVPDEVERTLDLMAKA